MPYKTSALPSGKYRVSSPHGVKAKATTKSKAAAQVRLLRGVEHGWSPNGSGTSVSMPDNMDADEMPMKGKKKGMPMM